MMTPIYAFSREGTQALQGLAGRRLLAALDFDGTLAPIALRPELVVTPPATRAALQRLSGLCLTAIISGRARDDVLDRVWVAVDFVLGNHGIEGLPGAEKVLSDCLAVSVNWLMQLRRGEVIDALGPGVFVEDKRYSLAVHYRQAHDPARAQQKLAERLPALRPAPRIVTGKYVFNLLPPAAVDKGTALLRLIELTHAQAALYVGDDDTDEDVFALQEPALLTVRVGHSAHSGARMYLRASQEIGRLVDLLVKRPAVAAAVPRR